MKNSLKKSVYVLSAVALSFTATTFAATVTAAHSMHYGKPSTQLLKSADFPAITITNNTNNQYYVSIWFSDGSSGMNWAIMPSYMYPQNVITADNPDASVADIIDVTTQPISQPNTGNIVWSGTNIQPGSDVAIGNPGSHLTVTVRKK